MEIRNNKQVSIVFEIEDLLNKMSNQVSFLIRKNMPMNQLDIDLLMENTRKLYDTLCSVETTTRNEESEVDVDDNLDNTIKDLDTTEEIIEEEEDLIEPSSNEFINSTEENDENVDMVWDFTKTENVDDNISDNDNISDELDTEDVIVENIVVEDTIDTSTSTNNFTDSKIEDSGIRVFTRIKDESYTLSDKLEQTEDISLAARLQKKPVTDLSSAIGINDKFLFLNELFNGSMEKFNKSIRALNSFSTLFGAKTYMSELQIEFQWNCESDAYKKLNDLVERRFL
jgi:hypothetical protein